MIPQNTFSGNAGYGLAIIGRAYDNQVFSSFIGTDDPRPARRWATRRAGSWSPGRPTATRSATPGSRPANLISGNAGNGVTLLPGTHDNRVIKNYIGLDRFGRPLRNSGRPILNLGYHNIILSNWS